MFKLRLVGIIVIISCVGVKIGKSDAFYFDRIDRAMRSFSLLLAAVFIPRDSHQLREARMENQSHVVKGKSLR